MGNNTEDLDIPIFRKTYDLYKVFYSYHATVPKQDRYTIWQRAENLILDVIEGILLASRTYKGEKAAVLEKTSVKLDFLRVFLRLMKEVQTIDNKRYAALQASVDEIGRQLGGWLKSAKEG